MREAAKSKNPKTTKVIDYSKIQVNSFEEYDPLAIPKKIQDKYNSDNDYHFSWQPPEMLEYNHGVKGYEVCTDDGVKVMTRNGDLVLMGMPQRKYEEEIEQRVLLRTDELRSIAKYKQVE